VEKMLEFRLNKPRRFTQFQLQLKLRATISSIWWSRELLKVLKMS